MLTIDAGRELDRLAADRLQGSWQLPAELARWAVSAGATRIEIEVDRRGAIVRASDVELAADAFDLLGAALDDATPEVKRHDALARIEHLGLLPLLSTAHIGSRASIDAGTRAATTEHRSLSIRDGTAAPREVRVSFAAPRWDADRARGHCRDACRFAPVAIVVDGVEAATGFRGALAVRQVPAPLPATLAIPREGSAPRLYLLVHGVLATRATLPGIPCFHAAVEMAGQTPWQDNGAALREALGPHVGPLIQAAVSLLTNAALRLDDLDEHGRRRIRRLLLEAAKTRLVPDAVDGFPLVPCLDRSGRPAAPLTLAELRAAVARRGSRQLLALDPAERPEDHLLLQAPVVVADEAERSLLAGLVGARIVAPRPAARRDRLPFVLRRFGRAFGAALRGR